jgi:pilus assembly protein CpaC
MTMNIKTILYNGVVAAALIAASASHAAPAKKTAAAPAAVSDKTIVMSVGRGQQVNLPSAVTDVVVADPSVADVDVRSSRQLYILAKTPGETTVYATDAAGRTIYSATIRVGANLDSVDQMLKLAMPEADITVSTMNGIVLLTGSVKQPEDIVEVESLVQQFVGGARVINRVKSATPMQVNLQVRIAEVSRSLSKDITSKFNTRDTDGPSGNGFLFVPSRGGNVATFADGVNPVTGAPSTTVTFTNPGTGNVLNMAKNLFGIDIALGLDFAERSGLASTLANPNLTTMSGETGEFLAGGSFPIPVADNFGSTSVQQQSYGVNLRYTPEVMADGRIRLRLKTEVSDITSQGAVRINGTEIPALLTRSAETTVELGSGQSFMIAGLLSNQATTSVDKFPGLGDVPVLGALFKSNGWKRNQSELVIVVTPYLVKPVSDSEIKLPTDGFNTPNDLERIILNKEAVNHMGQSDRPKPVVAPDAPSGPSLGSLEQEQPALVEAPKKPATKTAQKADGPGFTFD